MGGWVDGSVTENQGSTPEREPEKRLPDLRKAAHREAS